MENNSGNCSNVSHEQLEIIGFTHVGSGIVSVLACLFIFLIMLIHKKWIYHSQRLVLYLTLAVLVDSGIHIAQGLGYKMVYGGPYCTTIAFMDQLSDGFTLSAVGCLFLEITIQGNVRKDTTKLELLYLTIIFIVPIPFSCIPFAFDAYGPASVWCWIQAQNLTTCEPFLTGIILQYVLWYVPVVVVCLAGFVACGITLIKLHRHRKDYSGVFDPEESVLHNARMCELRRYLWYPLLFLVIDTIPLMARILTDIDPSRDLLGLWIVTSLLQGLKGSCIAFIFAIDSETRKRLSWKHLKAGCLYNILRKTDASEYPALTGYAGDSLNSVFQSKPAH